MVWYQGLPLPLNTPAIEIVRIPECERAVRGMLSRPEDRAAFDEAVDAILADDPEGGDRVPEPVEFGSCACRFQGGGSEAARV